MIQIVKVIFIKNNKLEKNKKNQANLIAEPSISYIYQLWLTGISCCNEGAL